jgi:hypothetical protein
MTKRSQPSAKANTKAKAGTATARRPSAQTIKKKPAAAVPAATTLKTDFMPAQGPARPGGKLGLIVDRLGLEAGATIEELTGMTGWQAHTVHAALSRLRSRGFAMRLDRDGDRNAYHLMRQGG